MRTGTVYWLTGLSGAGKTTVGVKLCDYLLSKKHQVVFFDGDELREILSNDDYSKEGREKLAFHYAGLSDLICRQGYDVVTCTVSMFDIVRDWNRKNISNYREVYLRIPNEELIRRDQKGIYTGAMNGTEDNVCGINLDVELPKNPDLVIDNYGEVTPEIALNGIIERFKL